MVKDEAEKKKVAETNSRGKDCKRACLKFSEYHNMSPNLVGYVDNNTQPYQSFF